MTEISYHVVDTDITKGNVHNKVLDAFCYGIFKGAYRTFFTTGSTNYLSFAFVNGEDALYFKIKELDVELLKIMDPSDAKRRKIKSK